MTVELCPCRCHRVVEQETLTGMVFVGVPVTDPLHAATACPSCLAKHSPALLGYEPPRSWQPSDDDATGEV